MKEQLNKVSSALFAVLIIIGVGLGAVAFVLFVIGLVLGGNGGAAISIIGGKLINYGIRISSVGILFGLIKIYTDGYHYLTLKKQKDGQSGLSA
ncbi:MAG: hypothetical protein ACOWWO_07660 [Peptococcaceae bacterium]